MMSELNTTTNPSAYDGKYTVLSQVIELRKTYDDIVDDATEALETANAAKDAARRNTVALEQVKTLRIGGTASVNLTHNDEDGSHSSVLGTNSVVAGQANTVSADSINALVSGSLNQIDGQDIIASGNLQRVDTGKNDIISGNDNNLTETSNCIISGDGNTMEYTANSFTTGNANTNSGRNSIMCGVGNVVYEEVGSVIMTGNANEMSTGANSIIAGDSNAAQFAQDSLIVGKTNNVTTTTNCSIIGGNDNTVEEAYSSMVIGTNNTVQHNNCIVGGVGNATTRNNQLLIGNYASPTDYTLFAIGSGTSDSNRRNIFYVNTAGTCHAPTMEATNLTLQNGSTPVTITGAQLQQLLALIQ